MILKIEISNFYSVKDKVCIDFRAANINTTKAKNLSYNVIEWNNIKILKTIGLFGPNASGKSNIIRAVDFCRRLILESHLYNEGNIFDFQPFKFDNFANKPSSFLINFVCENIEYEYSFEIIQTEILKENLFYYPNGRRAKIFTRDEQSEKKYTFGEGLIQRPQDIVLNTSKKNLFISRASSMNRDFAKKIYGYFFNSFISGIFQNADILDGNKFQKYKSLILRAMSVCDNDISNIEKVNGTSKYKTYHRRNPKISFDMDTDESAGTRRLFYILTGILDVLRNGKTILLDEFDLQLHTRLADFIIDLTHASKNSQLLFTSHNTNLIDVNRLRKDQILFVSKKEDSSTDLYSLYDYKDFRDTMDAQKAYIQGRFDAVPYVEASVSNLKTLLED